MRRVSSRVLGLQARAGIQLCRKACRNVPELATVGWQCQCQSSAKPIATELCACPENASCCSLHMLRRFDFSNGCCHCDSKRVLHLQQAHLTQSSSSSRSALAGTQLAGTQLCSTHRRDGTSRATRSNKFRIFLVPFFLKRGGVESVLSFVTPALRPQTCHVSSNIRVC